MKINNILLRFIGLFLFFSFFLVGCSGPFKGNTGGENISYTLKLVPVPDGGIVFPTGIGDDATARVNQAFYIGETGVTFGFWQEVAQWATESLTSGKYSNIYYDEHPYLWDDSPHLSSPKEIYPVNGVTWIQAMVWCNAYTEWYNYKNDTNLEPVYIKNNGEPIRGALEPFDPDLMGTTTWVGTRPYVEYVHDAYRTFINDNNGVENYFNNVEVTGGGFRLPTPIEWELAARWNGSDSTNTVTKTINGINFANQPIKFTKGNSVSGAKDWVGNLEETGKYAVYEYNSRKEVWSIPKTKAPNALGLFDMSGNLREFVYENIFLDIPSKYDAWGSVVEKSPMPFGLSRGMDFRAIYEDLALGQSGVYVDCTAYNYYYGFRVVRTVE
jgi:formylglycine-generating enzyme required for sulfatase activity